MGTRKDCLGEAVLMNPTIYVLSRNMKIDIRVFFLSEKVFFFLVVKFSVYLNRHVFVMSAIILQFLGTSLGREKDLLKVQHQIDEINLTLVLLNPYMPCFCKQCRLLKKPIDLGLYCLPFSI